MLGVFTSRLEVPCSSLLSFSKRLICKPKKHVDPWDPPLSLPQSAAARYAWFCWIVNMIYRWVFTFVAQESHCMAKCHERNSLHGPAWHNDLNESPTVGRRGRLLESRWTNGKLKRYLRGPRDLLQTSHSPYGRSLAHLPRRVYLAICDSGGVEVFFRPTNQHVIVYSRFPCLESNSQTIFCLRMSGTLCKNIMQSALTSWNYLGFTEMLVVCLEKKSVLAKTFMTFRRIP